MALAPLATVADVEARGVTVDSADVGTLTTFLATASAAVREAAGCPVSQATSTVTGLYAEGSAWLTLPGLPVSAVASALVDGVGVSGWSLRNSRLHRAAGWDGEVTVTYTHGLPDVPADVVDMVCRLALAGLIAAKASPDGSDLAASRVWQERIGDYYVMYRQDGGGLSEIELPAAIASSLRARFGGGVGLLMSR